MSDEIDMLPVNKTETLDAAEAARLKPYTAAAAGAAPPTFWEANKKYLIIIAAFFILSIPFIDGLLTKLTGNAYFTLLLKVILFVVAVVIASKL